MWVKRTFGWFEEIGSARVTLWSITQHILLWGPIQGFLLSSFLCQEKSTNPPEQEYVRFSRDKRTVTFTKRRRDL